MQQREQMQPDGQLQEQDGLPPLAAVTRPHLLLIGPTGAGKSTIGRRLAVLLGWPFVDLDELIEARSGVSIPLIFEYEGEAGFRQREAALLAEVLAASAPAVVATGAGAVLDPRSRETMRARARVVYLQVPVAVQLQRLAGDQRRPLLQGVDARRRLEEMARLRTPLYQALADVTVDSVGHKPGRCARRIATMLGWQDERTDRDDAET